MMLDFCCMAIVKAGMRKDIRVSVRFLGDMTLPFFGKWGISKSNLRSKTVLKSHCHWLVWLVDCCWLEQLVIVNGHEWLGLCFWLTEVLWIAIISWGMLSSATTQLLSKAMSWLVSFLNMTGILYGECVGGVIRQLSIMIFPGKGETVSCSSNAHLLFMPFPLTEPSKNKLLTSRNDTWFMASPSDNAKPTHQVLSVWLVEFPPLDGYHSKS